MMAKHFQVEGGAGPNTWSTLFVGVGECTVIEDPNVALATVLGSCVSLCARDPRSGVGGMNHFLLPVASGASPDQREAKRYGAFAIEDLLNRVCATAQLRDRSRLELKGFGGAAVMAGACDVGRRNVEILREILHRDGLSLTAQDFGGAFGRRILFHPASGRAFSRRTAITPPPSQVASDKKQLAELF